MAVHSGMVCMIGAVRVLRRGRFELLWRLAVSSSSMMLCAPERKGGRIVVRVGVVAAGGRGLMAGSALRLATPYVRAQSRPFVRCWAAVANANRTIRLLLPSSSIESWPRVMPGREDREGV